MTTPEDPTREQPAAGAEREHRAAPAQPHRWWAAIPRHLGRARTSTLVLVFLFLAVGVLYLYVKPEDEAHRDGAHRRHRGHRTGGHDGRHDGAPAGVHHPGPHDAGRADDHRGNDPDTAARGDHRSGADDRDGAGPDHRDDDGRAAADDGRTHRLRLVAGQRRRGVVTAGLRAG